MSRALAAALTVALLVAGLGAASAADAGKRKHRHHKPYSPLFKRLAGHSLNRVVPDSSGAAGGERYNFCRKGGYSYKKAGGSGATYFETSFHGRWRVASSAGSSGVVQYTVTSFASGYADGSPFESYPGSPLAQPVTFGPFGVYFGGQLFSRGKAKC